MLAVDSTGKSRDGWEHEKQKISKGSVGSDCETKNKAASSVVSATSTSKTMVAADAKENGELVPPMKMDTFTFQLATWRRDVDRELEVSIDINENNLIQVLRDRFGRRKESNNSSDSRLV